MDWTQPTEGKWQTKVTAAKHFTVKYTIQSDEDGMLTGFYEVRYRIRSKEADQYDSHEIPVPSTDDLATMQKSVESWHVERVYPALLQMVEEHDRPDDDE